VVADAAFGPVARPAITLPPGVGGGERPPRTAPLHRYVSLHAGATGVTLYGDGLAEYEAMPDGRLAVTLVRAVGELSRPDLSERPGHAGWPAATPEAQCRGPFEASFALLYHGPDSPATRDLIERTADDVLLPLVGETQRAALDLAVPTGGLELDGEGLAFSAAVPLADGCVALRCVNVTDQPVDGRWRVQAPLAHAALGRLDGTSVAPLAVTSDAGSSVVAFRASPRAVVTVLVRGRAADPPGVEPPRDAPERIG
jgi:alpha-mannosidase